MVGGRHRLSELRGRRRASRSVDGGFTLIELLIVVVILGILAAVVVFAVGNTRGTAVRSACRSDRKAVIVAVEAYRAETGQWPASGDGAWAQLTPRFLRENPNEDGKEYTIAVGGNGVVNTTPQCETFGET